MQINKHFLQRYNKFISTLQTQQIPESIGNEIHHIVPKSLNGSNDKSNLIRITSRQHFIAHWMLWKAYGTNELTYCFWAMAHQKNKSQQNRYTKINSRTYAILKAERSRIISENNANRWKDEEWAKQMKITLSKAASTPEEKLRRSKQACKTNNKYKEANSKNMKSLWQNKEWRDNMTAKIKKGATRRIKPIMINGIEYESTKAVIQEYNICASEVRRRIKSQTPTYISWQYKAAAEEAPGGF
jgi:hypothetical protein